MQPEFHPAAARELSAAVHGGEEHRWPRLGSQSGNAACDLDTVRNAIHRRAVGPILSAYANGGFPSRLSIVSTTIGCRSWRLLIAVGGLGIGVSGNDRDSDVSWIGVGKFPPGNRGALE